MKNKQQGPKTRLSLNKSTVVKLSNANMSKAYGGQQQSTISVPTEVIITVISLIVCEQAN